MYIGEPHAYSAIIRNYITHPRICSVLDHIIGAHIPFWDGAYKCMQTMFVTKQPKANGSPWHQDEHPVHHECAGPPVLQGQHRHHGLRGGDPGVVRLRLPQL